MMDRHASGGGRGSGAARRSGLDPALLARAAPLPAASFVDPATFERERERLFVAGANYLAHQRIAPGAGDFWVPPADHGARALVRDRDGLRLVSNICRHRQAMLLTGQGRVERVVCPLHGWTYDRRGTLLGAPGFGDTATGCNLAATPLIDWRGLQFAGPADPRPELAGFGFESEFDWDDLVHDRTVVDSGEYNWKEFIEVYQDICHVGPTHPGLRRWVDLDRYEWRFGSRWTHQVFEVNQGLRHQASPHYAAYRDALLRHRGGELPTWGCVWSIVYPNLMLEWYPCALVLSSLVPLSADRTTNVVEFYYPAEVHANARDLVEAHQAAYLETAAEDSANCERLHQGRRALWLGGADDAGPFHAPHEHGVIHFIDWYRRQFALSDTP